MVLPPAVQAVSLALMLILAGGLSYLAIRCVAAERMVAASRATEIQVELANLDLKNAIAALREKLGAVTRDRAQVSSQRMGTGHQKRRTAALDPAGQNVPALGQRPSTRSSGCSLRPA